jgi:hypothetical protein
MSSASAAVPALTDDEARHLIIGDELFRTINGFDFTPGLPAENAFSANLFSFSATEKKAFESAGD